MRRKLESKSEKPGNNFGRGTRNVQLFQNISMKFSRVAPVDGALRSITHQLHLTEPSSGRQSPRHGMAGSQQERPLVSIYIRHRADSPIEEVRGIGQFNVPISVLKGVLADVAKYSEFMPYTKESRVLPQDAQLCYMVLKPPLVGSLDYTIRVHEESLTGADGGTSYHSSWELANTDGPAPRPGVTRVTANEGSWLLEPIGNQTRATYTLYTDGGGIPPLLMNFANKQSISRLFDALRTRMRASKQE